MMWMEEFSKIYVHKYAAVEVKCSDKTLNPMKFTMLLVGLSRRDNSLSATAAQVNSILCALLRSIIKNVIIGWASFSCQSCEWEGKNCISRRMPSNQEIIKIQSLFSNRSKIFLSSGMFSCAVECNTEFNVVCMVWWNLEFHIQCTESAVIRERWWWKHRFQLTDWLGELWRELTIAHRVSCRRRPIFTFFILSAKCRLCCSSRRLWEK